MTIICLVERPEYYMKFRVEYKDESNFVMTLVSDDLYVNLCQFIVFACMWWKLFQLLFLVKFIIYWITLGEKLRGR